MSFGTVFVFLFLLFSLVLAASLVGISVQELVTSSNVQNADEENLRSTLLNLAKSSNSLLITTSITSINIFVDQIFELVNGIILNSVSTYVSNAEFVVKAMAFSCRKGDFSLLNMSKSYRTIWDIQQLYPLGYSPTYADVGMQVALTNNFDGTFDLELQKCSECECDVCDPIALPQDKYFYTLTKPYQTTGFAFSSNETYNVSARPWFPPIVAADGAGVWTPPYAFSYWGIVGITAGLLVRDDAGRYLGVVTTDVIMSALSQYLLSVRGELVNDTARIGAAERRLAEEGLHFVLLDPHGIVIGTSTDDNLTILEDGNLGPAAWWQVATQVVPSLFQINHFHPPGHNGFRSGRGRRVRTCPQVIETPSLRAALDVVNASLGGDWAPAFASGYRTYAAGGGLFVSTKAGPDPC